MGMKNGFTRKSALKRRWTWTRIDKPFTPNIRIPRLVKTNGVAGELKAGSSSRIFGMKSVTLVAQKSLQGPKNGPQRPFDLNTRSMNWRLRGLTPDAGSVRKIAMFPRMKRKGMSPMPRAWVMTCLPKSGVLERSIVTLRRRIRTRPLVFGHLPCLGFVLSYSFRLFLQVFVDDLPRK